MAKVHTDKEFDDLMAAAFEESVVPYIEAVASTIEGRANGRAWHDFELVTARAILLSYLLGLSQVIEDAEIAGADFFSDKATYAKSGCGANAEGGGGFQPGNTCAGDGDGKAEPGESRHKTSTPEFKAWFGDSKVVDKSGEPLVVYHGSTQKDLQLFDPRETMEVEGAFFFTNDEHVASDYTWERAYGEMIGDEPVGEVVSSYLSFQNPLEYKGGNVYGVTKPNQKIIDAVEMGMAVELAKSKGHDGLIIRNIDDTLQADGRLSDVYVAFDNKQIKSATDNTGSFDPDNPKITHAKSDCGAGEDDAPGFQPGNTCAGEGGAVAEDKPKGAPGTDKEKQQAQVKTPEFKTWYGDSKIVDEDGEPMPLYQGSNLTDFTGDFQFDPKYIGSGHDEGFYGRGFYFARNRGEARYYGENVGEFFIRMENPFEMGSTGGTMQEMFLHARRILESLDEPRLITDEFRKTAETHDQMEAYVRQHGEMVRHQNGGYVLKGEHPVYGEMMSAVRRVVGQDDEGRILYGGEPTPEKAVMKTVYDWMSNAHGVEYTSFTDYMRTSYPSEYTGSMSRLLSDTVQARGYDGIIVGSNEKGEYGWEYDEIVVFDPTQIKSATNNTGSFDPEDPKITHAKETYAKEDWPMEVGFEEFSAEPFQEAIDLFEDRVPMLANNAPQIADIARQQAAEIAMAERMGVVAKLDAQTNAISKSIGEGFWVTGIDDRDVLLDLKKVLAQSMRGVMPDDRITLPDFLSMDWLKKSSVLTANRLETIYRTNLQSAFNEGHMASMRSPEVKSVAPLAMIVEIQDPRSRDHHAAMDGYINTVEYFDRFQIAPPNGFNCRGTVRVVSWTEAENLGLVGDDGEIDWKALERYNGNRQGYIDRGEYPDPGFTDRAA